MRLVVTRGSLFLLGTPRFLLLLPRIRIQIIILNDNTGFVGKSLVALLARFEFLAALLLLAFTLCFHAAAPAALALFNFRCARTLTLLGHAFEKSLAVTLASMMTTTGMAAAAFATTSSSSAFDLLLDLLNGFLDLFNDLLNGFLDLFASLLNFFLDVSAKLLRLFLDLFRLFLDLFGSLLNGFRNLVESSPQQRFLFDRRRGRGTKQRFRNFGGQRVS